MQESRTLNIFTTTTKTETGVSTQGAGADLRGYVNLPKPATAATFLLNVTTASGTMRTVIQRGIRGAVGDNGLPTTAPRDDIQWFDYASFTTTSSAGRQILPVVYTSTASTSFVTGTASMPSNHQYSGPLGTIFRGAVELSGVSPTFTFSVVGEFEF